MSIPYFVHKEDADRYDKMRYESDLIRSVQETLSKDLDLSTKEGADEYGKIQDSLTPAYRRVKEKYAPLRIISSLYNGEAMDGYYTYFRGHRLDDPAFAQALIKIGYETVKSMGQGD